MLNLNGAFSFRCNPLLLLPRCALRNGVKVKAFRRKNNGRLPKEDDELMLLARYLVLVAKRKQEEGKGWEGLNHMDWKNELKRLG